LEQEQTVLGEGVTQAKYDESDWQTYQEA